MCQRRGDWISTYTGRQFWVLDPRPSDIHIADIAHGLSNNCRYVGQCSFFYPVGQHSVLMARAVGGPPIVRLCCLLHDGSEAYLPDMPRPIKRMPEFSFYRDRGRDHASDRDTLRSPVADATRSQRG